MQRLVVMERGWKPNVEISPNCPRCGSSNTKFCYYNNYCLTQPRYFCKGCRRYWTNGGSLRSVPVGGGCRKSRRGNNKKTLRQSIDGVKHSDDLKRASSSSSPSSLGSDGPNIDLAQVYASFLNPKSEYSEADLQKPDQEQTVFYTSPEYFSLSNTDFGQSTSLLEELGLTGCLHLPEQSTESHFMEEGSVQVYLCGFNSIQNQKHLEYSTCNDTKNFDELPPLPGEEALPSHDMLWSNSEMMVDHALQATQQTLFGAEAHDAELLMGNWRSPFDLSSWDASFSRP